VGRAPPTGRSTPDLARIVGGAGGIDLEFTVDALLKQTDDNLAKGFPGDQDEG
jgi:hypothetical protein